MSRREDLFGDFIAAASRACGEALVSSEPKIQELIGLDGVISKMRVQCLPRTIACTDQVMVTTIDTYFAPNKTVRELQEHMKTGAGIDPLKEFSEAARQELQVFASQ